MQRAINCASGTSCDSVADIDYAECEGGIRAPLWRGPFAIADRFMHGGPQRIGGSDLRASRVSGRRRRVAGARRRAVLEEPQHAVAEADEKKDEAETVR